MSSPNSGERWVVVGGGVAGLLAARRLARAGAAVTLLEAGSAVGGRTSALTIDGLEWDAGAESFATRGGVVADLARELGLGELLVSPNARPAWVVSPDRSYPLPSAGWLGIPLRPLAPEVRRIVRWRAALRAAGERRRPLGPLGDDATVGAVVRARLGDAIADRLVAPVMSGVYSRPIDELPLAAIDRRLPADIRAAGSLLAAVAARRTAAPSGAAVQGIVGGVSQLVAAVEREARDAGAHLVTSAPATAVDRRDGAWRVVGGGGTLIADGVVLAVPRDAAAELWPSLAGDAHGTGQRSVALVTLALDAPELDGAPRGTGVLATGGVARAKALTHATAKWGWLAEAAGRGRHVVRLSYAVSHPGEDMSGCALEDASRLLGVPLDPAQVRATHQAWWPDASPLAVPTANPEPGLFLVGSAAGLSGLAAIVAADAQSSFRSST